MQHKELGIAVVGAGRIGRLRASLAAVHPAVRFLAISDLDPGRARALAEKVGAQFHSGNNLDIISRPEVNAVIVSTSEHEHATPVLQALELGKPVLVEKPIALSLEDADRMIRASAKAGVPLRVGYSRRFLRSYLLAKEQIRHGRLGRILGVTARVYSTRASMFQILQRSRHATPVMDILTYYADLVCWFLEGNPPVEVVARGQGTIFKGAGYSADDVTWAILTFADGAVVNLGVCYILPAKYPSFGMNDRMEVLGSEGVMLFDGDHKDQTPLHGPGNPPQLCPRPPHRHGLLEQLSSGRLGSGRFLGASRR